MVSVDRRACLTPRAAPWRDPSCSAHHDSEVHRAGAGGRRFASPASGYRQQQRISCRLRKPLRSDPVDLSGASHVDAALRLGSLDGSWAGRPASRDARPSRILGCQDSAPRWVGRGKGGQCRGDQTAAPLVDLPVLPPRAEAVPPSAAAALVGCDRRGRGRRRRHAGWLAEGEASSFVFSARARSRSSRARPSGRWRGRQGVNVIWKGSKIIALLPLLANDKKFALSLFCYNWQRRAAGLKRWPWMRGRFERTRDDTPRPDETERGDDGDVRRGRDEGKKVTLCVPRGLFT
jgi:hypothetical protein